MITIAAITNRPLEWWLEGLEQRRKAKLPDKFDGETLEFAREFAKLKPPGRAKFRALLVLSTNGATDKEVEAKMPVTVLHKKKKTGADNE